MRFLKFTILFFLFISCSRSFAQYNTMKEWYIGFSGGKTMSTISLVPKLVDKLFTINNNGGISLRYVSENHFGIQTEFNYYQSGWKEDLQGFGLTHSYLRRLDLVEIPFFMHAYTGSGRMRYFLNIGPKLGYLISEKEEIVDNTTSFEQHGKLVENPFQYGIAAGLGFEVHFGRSVFGLEGRYCYNFSNIFDDAIGQYFNTSSIQTISLNLSYYFQLTK